MGDHLKGVEMTERVGHVGEKVNVFCDLVFERETKRWSTRSGRWQQSNVNLMRNK